MTKAIKENFYVNKTFPEFFNFEIVKISNVGL